MFGGLFPRKVILAHGNKLNNNNFCVAKVKVKNECVKYLFSKIKGFGFTLVLVFLVFIMYGSIGSVLYNQ